MSRSLKLIIIIVITISFWLLVDRLLPREEMDTHVHQLNQPTGPLVYGVPLSGGELDTCALDTDELSALWPHAEIVVERTLLLGRCVSVKPIRCVGMMCSPLGSRKIDADALVQKALHVAYGEEYENIASLSADHPGYSPQVRRWPIIREPLVPERYSIRLPEQLVIFDKDANFITTRKCGSTGGYCQAVERTRVEGK